MAILSEIYNLKNQLSGAEIKSLYEVQPDTNVYSDSEKNKVSVLYFEPTDVKTANYSANTNEAVLCDTTGGSFTVTLPASGQVKIVDAGGDSQDTGFGNNPLTVATLGLQTVLGDSDGITLDSGITSITFQYIDNDWKIIDLVVPKIQVIDWDDVVNKPDVALVEANETVTGAYTFTGPLILPNNSRVNGIEHFYQTTKPTTRGDSSALVAGDRWWKTDEGTEWFWNGTYWLSPIVFATGFQAETADLIANPSGRTTAFILPPEPNSFLLREISFEISTNGYWTKVTAEQHHIFQLNRANNWGNFVALTGATYNTFTGVGDKNSTNYVGVTAAGSAPVTIVVNEVINNNPAIDGSFLRNNFRGIIITATAVGSPMTGSPLNLRSQNISISYNTIHP